MDESQKLRTAIQLLKLQCDFPMGISVCDKGIPSRKYAFRVFPCRKTM